MNTKKVIWILEDDLDMESVYKELLYQDYQITCLKNLEELRQALQTDKPDLLVADINLPDGIFLTLYREFKETLFKEFPVIVISSIDDKSSLMEAFDLGAADYLTKPFNTKEFLVKIQRLVQTRSSRDHQGAISLDQKKLQLQIKNEVVHLTPKEFRIVNTFFDRPDFIAEKKSLYETIWGKTEDQQINSKTLEVHISNLRKKVQPHGFDVAYIAPDCFQLKAIEPKK